jgi:hypothetical protein
MISRSVGVGNGGAGRFDFLSGFLVMVIKRLGNPRAMGDDEDAGLSEQRVLPLGSGRSYA